MGARATSRSSTRIRPTSYTEVATVSTFAGAKTITVDAATHNAYSSSPSAVRLRRHRPTRHHRRRDGADVDAVRRVQSSLRGSSSSSSKLLALARKIESGLGVRLAPDPYSMALRGASAFRPGSINGTPPGGGDVLPGADPRSAPSQTFDVNPIRGPPGCFGIGAIAVQQAFPPEQRSVTALCPCESGESGRPGQWAGRAW